MANVVREQRTRGVHSVDHALAILTAFQTDTPLLGPTDLSQRLGLSKSAIHALLASLERAGFVVRHEQLGKYALGPRLLHLASLRLEQMAIRPLARPLLERLALQLDETAFLGVVEGGQAIYADRVESRQRLRISGEIGTPVSLHGTALGKVLLANLPDSRIDTELTRPLEAFTAHTFAEAGPLREELRLIRLRGFAVSRGEHEEFTAGVAAPVFDHTNTLVAGLTVAGPMGRLPIEIATEAVVRAARDLSGRLGATATHAA